MPWSRQHRRALKYALGAVLLFSTWYILWGRPVDVLGITFERHERYMNDRTGIKRLVAKDSYDWRKAPFYNDIKSYTPLPSGLPRHLPPIQFDFPTESNSHRHLRETRRVAVRDEFRRSWASYKRYAWGRDELSPLTGMGGDPFGGWGATLIDSLDTLWIMGLRDDFYEAVKAVASTDFGESSMSTISVFETTIRYLGGLLSAYDLSHEKVLLDKAIQLGEMLYRAFDTDNHMPLDRLSLLAAKNNESTGFNAESNICFAAIGSLTMEFTRLAQLTGEPKYYDAVASVTDFFDRHQNTTRVPGLFPTWINAYKEDISNDRSFTVGAMADSSYEYFPKMYALLGGLEPVYQKLHGDSAKMINKYMLFRPMLPESEHGEELLYCGNLQATSPENTLLDTEMQHLTCFIGGYFALAGRLFKDESQVQIGARLTEGCIYAYNKMPTGVMPEIFDMVACESRTSCPWNTTQWEEQVLRRAHKADADAATIIKDLKLPEGFAGLRDKRYLLRPEAIESVFIMYRVTGHEEYLEHAWDMFRSIRKASRTEFANGQVMDVTATDPLGVPEDKMESFWLAETLKYFYLIFSPPDMIHLDDWVFNTEAHPFRRPKLQKTSGDV